MNRARGRGSRLGERRRRARRGARQRRRSEETSDRNGRRGARRHRLRGGRCGAEHTGAALRDVHEADVAPEALAHVMARLDETPPEAIADTRPLLQRLPLKAKKWVAPGAWVAAVDTPHAPEDRVYLLRVGAGMPAARHQHSGAEFCTILKGAYRDELGLFAAGDFAFAEGHFNHQPMVEPQEECICLFATEGRLKPHDLIGRIAFALADV